MVFRPATGMTSRLLAALCLFLATASCRDGSADTGEARARAFGEAREGNPVTAVRLLQRVIGRDPSDSAAYAQLADLYRRYGWTSDGYEFFTRRAARSKPPLPELRYYAAAFAAFAGRSDEAERWISVARTRRPPTEAEALATAEALGVLGRDSAARSLLEDAVRLNPDRFEPQVRLVIALAQAGDTAAAFARMTSALERFPNEGRVVGAAAELHFLTGQLDASERLTHRWIELTPNAAEARWNLTRIALRSNDYKRADSLLFLTARTGR